MSMSDDEWGFDDAIAQEESFLQEDAFLPPGAEAEEPFLVETTDTPAIPIVPANANPAEPEAEPATDESAHIAVLPLSQDVTMSSSPSVRRKRLRDKTTPHQTALATSGLHLSASKRTNPPSSRAT